MIKTATAYAIAALTLALLGVCGYAWWLYNDRDDARGALQHANAELDRIAVDVGKCRLVNTGWQHALDTSQGALKNCVQQRDDAMQVGARAVAVARAAADKTRADADIWRARFDAARRDPDCATTLEAVLCASVSDY